MLPMKQYAEFSAALLTPILACLTVWIAMQQWRTNQLKVKHELYERRLAVYLALMEFLAAVGQNARCTDDQLRTFLQKTRESWFLFGEDIGEYLDDIYRRAVDLKQRHTVLHEPGSLPIGPEREETAREQSASMKWFSAQFEIARTKFARYMKLS